MQVLFDLFWGFVQVLAYCVILFWVLVVCVGLATFGLTMLIFWRHRKQ